MLPNVKHFSLFIFDHAKQFPLSFLDCSIDRIRFERLQIILDESFGLIGFRPSGWEHVYLSCYAVQSGRVDRAAVRSNDNGNEL